MCVILVHSLPECCSGALFTAQSKVGADERTSVKHGSILEGLEQFVVGGKWLQITCKQYSALRQNYDVFTSKSRA